MLSTWLTSIPPRRNLLLMTRYLLVIDEGTTSTRALLFSPNGTCAGMDQRELTQFYPEPGRVEHDAREIWDKTLACAQAMVDQAGGAANIAGIGITNQRETIVFWDRISGEPLAPAIVWQDRRTADICATLKEGGHEPLVQSKTGLLLDPYFSGSKIGWALTNWPELNAAGDRLAVGTIESWLIFKLTGGLHVTDATNASRTALMDIESGAWDADLCALFDVPLSILPTIIDCAGAIGTTQVGLLGGAIPITGVAGDQQAATIGQACLVPGQTKSTFGTGAFVLTQTGTRRPHSRNRLLATIAWQVGGERHFALEGSVFVAGSLLQWLRDELGLIKTSADSEGLARSVADNGGVYLVPALAGLGAPHWRPDASGTLSGLSFATQRAHIIRAALEAMSYQVNDLQSAFAADDAPWAEVRIDGGMSANDWLAQDLADILNVPVERPAFVETTALGAAMLAGVGCGLYPSLDAASVMRGQTDHFQPAMAVDVRAARLAGWQDALGRLLS